MGMIKGLHAEMRILISNYHLFIQQMYFNIYHTPGIDLGAGVKTPKKKLPYQLGTRIALRNGESHSSDFTKEGSMIFT